MWEDNLEDTIAAIATASGEGGIGIVRLSGKKSLEIAGKIFVSRSGKKAKGFKGYSMHYGRIIDAASAVDEVILTVMRGPKSYTRQDVVEINCHGGMLALQRILGLTLKHGCRLASPGEFTKRAFLNGRIDLAQAEAVIDLIRAKTDSALKISLAQLSGGLSSRINKIRAQLVGLLAAMEASIDFPEEGLDQEQAEKTALRLAKIDKTLLDLLSGSSSARILREGLRVVICGKPNVGKSSLLNALLKQERAIVTPVAGTTRDTIEELLDIRGVPVKIVDTAGILRPRNLIEKKAVRLAHGQIDSADLVILLFDAGKKLELADRQLLRRMKNKNTLAVINKIDLVNRVEKEQIREVFSTVIPLSARSGKNLNLLEEAVHDFVYRGHALPELELVSNLRHIQALKEAQRLVAQAGFCLKQRLSPEFATQNLKDACLYLDRILGKDFSADVLDKIFADFCIGK